MSQQPPFNRFPWTKRLHTLLGELGSMQETARGPVSETISVENAVAVSESLNALTVSVDSLSGQSHTALLALIEAINKSSVESGRAATQAQNLASKLNRLTVWIVAAAVFSTIAAFVQAGIAAYAIFYHK